MRLTTNRRTKGTLVSTAVLFGAAMLALGGVATPVAAQDERDRPGAGGEAPQAASEQRRFDIAAQPLTSALTRFGQQANLQVSVDGALVRDLQSRGISGVMSSRRALSQLLAGTRLRFRFTAPDTVTLLAPQAAHGDGPSPATALAMGRMGRMGNRMQTRRPSLSV